MSEPIHIISLGAGVQSSTMALMAAAGEITPMPVAAIFADTQAEPKSVYTWLDWLEKQLPFPVHRVTAGSLEERAIRRVKKDGTKCVSGVSIPHFTLSDSNKVGISIRTCTNDYKLVPLFKKVKQICGITRVTKNAACISWIGISVDEASRMKDSREKWVINRWPLVELGMNRQNCFKWMENKKFPKPPRSACVFCPYHSDHEWRRLKTTEPEEFERAVKFEQKLIIEKSTSQFRSIPFLHRSCKPLSEVDFSTEEERGQLNMFNNECEGMCGV